MYFGSACLLYASGEFIGAIELLLANVKLYPQDVESYKLLSEIWNEQGHRNKALSSSILALLLNTNDACSWSFAAQKCGSFGNFFRRKQIAYFFMNSLMLKRNRLIYFKLFLILEELSEYELADCVIEKLSRTNPVNMEVMKIYSKILYRKGNFQRSLTMLQNIWKCTGYVDITVVYLIFSLRHSERCVEINSQDVLIAIKSFVSSHLFLPEEFKSPRFHSNAQGNGSFFIDYYSRYRFLKVSNDLDSHMRLAGGNGFWGASHYVHIFNRKSIRTARKKLIEQLKSGLSNAWKLINLISMKTSTSCRSFYFPHANDFKTIMCKKCITCMSSSCGKYDYALILLALLSKGQKNIEFCLHSSSMLSSTCGDISCALVDFHLPQVSDIFLVCSKRVYSILRDDCLLSFDKYASFLWGILTEEIAYSFINNFLDLHKSLHLSHLSFTYILERGQENQEIIDKVVGLQLFLSIKICKMFALISDDIHISNFDRHSFTELADLSFHMGLASIDLARSPTLELKTLFARLLSTYGSFRHIDRNDVKADFMQISMGNYGLQLMCNLTLSPSQFLPNTKNDFAGKDLQMISGRQRDWVNFINVFYNYHRILLSMRLFCANDMFSAIRPRHSVFFLSRDYSGKKWRVCEYQIFHIHARLSFNFTRLMFQSSPERQVENLISHSHLTYRLY